jgi:DNA-binding NtrC family response regulator
MGRLASTSPCGAHNGRRFRVNAPRRPRDSRPLRVLLVEDDLDGRVSGRVLLGAAGFEVVTAVNAAEAMHLFGTAGVDVVVTDILMPGEDGLALIRALRRLRPNLPIVAISGGGVSHDLSALHSAAGLGVEALEKPFKAGELVAAIRRAVERAG